MDKKRSQVWQGFWVMSFADACLVRMSEQIANSAVMTLDNDFRIYHKHRHEEILVIQP